MIEDGVSYLQLDSLHYVERITDTTIRPQMVAEGEDPDAYLDMLIKADNAVLAGARRDGLTVGLHMCRGNNRGKWMGEGGYEFINAGARVTNPASRRVLEKCGFQWTGAGLLRIRALSSSAPIDRFRLDRGLWASLKSWGAGKRAVA